MIGSTFAHCLSKQASIGLWIKMKKTFVIGDVHGCFYTLIELVSKLPRDAKLIFTGDLCDKGLFTKEVIDFVKNNKHQCVLGNHDYHMSQLLKSALQGEKFKWNTNDDYAGYTTVSSYSDVDEQIVDDHIEWMSNLPKYLEIDNFFITHGFGLPYYKRRDKFDYQLRVNRLSSSKYISDWENDWQDYKVINIFGHDSSNEVFVGKNYYGIDTGCKYSNKLTAIELGSMEIIQVKTNIKDIKNLEE